MDTTGPPQLLERDPRSYTPKHLADQILQSKSALEGERKQVTVLFADVKGSMELAEQVDPEEWHQILDHFFQILADGVHRFEGTINQYTGDGIMALFGAPLAHEDHAQRACYAALWLRQELRRYADQLRRTEGLSLSTRIGLNSGDVVVGKIGDNLRMDYTAQGQTVGLAARIEELCEPGTAFLTASTAHLVEGFFELQDLGEFDLKGVAAPARVYELEGAGPLRTRLDLARLRGFSRFVGRADEMTTLELAFNRAAEGSGQVVGVVGEAGVGKSRLCEEFAERCRTKGIRVNDAHCPAHGKTVPFIPVLELLRSFFRITEQDTDAEARQKIAGALVLLDTAFQETLPLIFDFLGVPDPDRPAPRMDPEGRQRLLFGFVRRLIQQRAEREAAVILIDDLHWIDSGSDAFLAEAVEAVSATRTMLLVNFRPEYHAEWASKSYYHQIPLAPLGAEEVGELLDSLLGQDPSVAGLHELIQERTGGNPFFIEEVVWSLAEGGNLEGEPGRYRLVTPVQAVEVPSSVQAVLAARIDRLSEPEKRVLQTAAVIGKEFLEPILEAAAELPKANLAEALTRLKASEFIYERALYPVAEYAFKHPLVQEVALASQLQDRRRRIHGTVARAMEAAHPDKLDEQAALLAHHWEEAGEALEAARWHRRAGEWAGTSHAAEAAHHWKRVRLLLRGIPESAETDEIDVAACQQLLGLSFRLGTSEEEVRALFDEGKRRADRLGNLRSNVALALAYGRALCSLGQVGEYLEIAQRAERLAEGSDDAGVQMSARAVVIDSHVFAGDFQTALILADQAFRRFPPDFHLGIGVLPISPYGLFSFHRGFALHYSGSLTEATQEFNRTLEIASKIGSPELAHFAHSQLAVVAGHLGDAQRVLAEAERVLQIAEKMGNPPRNLAAAHRLYSHGHILAGNWEAAKESALAALALHRNAQVELATEPAALNRLAESLLGSGDWSGACRVAHEALSKAQQSLTKRSEINAHRLLALSLLRSDGMKVKHRIEAVLAQAESLVKETGARVYTPQLHEARAEVARVFGDEGEAERHLGEAHRLYTEMGATRHAERLARELGL